MHSNGDRVKSKTGVEAEVVGLLDLVSGERCVREEAEALALHSPVSSGKVRFERAKGATPSGTVTQSSDEHVKTE